MGVWTSKAALRNTLAVSTNVYNMHTLWPQSICSTEMPLYLCQNKDDHSTTCKSPDINGHLTYCRYLQQDTVQQRE